MDDNMLQLIPAWEQEWADGPRISSRDPRTTFHKPPRTSSCSRCRRPITTEPPDKTGVPMRNRTRTKSSNSRDRGITTRRHLFYVTLSTFFVISCAFILYFLVLTTNTTAQAATPRQDGQSTVEAGQKMFQSTCANSYCH